MFMIKYYALKCHVPLWLHPRCTWHFRVYISSWPTCTYRSLVYCQYQEYLVCPPLNFQHGFCYSRQKSDKIPPHWAHSPNLTTGNEMSQPVFSAKIIGTLSWIDHWDVDASTVIYPQTSWYTVLIWSLGCICLTQCVPPKGVFSNPCKIYFTFCQS